eukprot:365574-Chlamydomonas_euryale.AAC.8
MVAPCATSGVHSTVHHHITVHFQKIPPYITISPCTSKRFHRSSPYHRALPKDALQAALV